MYFNQVFLFLFLGMAVLQQEPGGVFFTSVLAQEEDSIAAVSRSYLVILELIGRPAFIDEIEIASLAENARIAYTNSEKSAQILGTAEFTREVVAAQILTNQSAVGSDLFDQFNLSSLQTNSSLTSNEILKKATQPFNLLLELNTTCNGCASNQSLFTNMTDTNRFFFSYDPWYGPNPDSVAYKMNRLILPGKEAGIFAAVDKVVALQELETIDCSEKVISLDTQVVVNFLGDPTLATDDELQALAGGFEETYNFLNGLNAERCDPFARRVEEVTIDTTTTPSRRSLQMGGIYGNTSFESLNFFTFFFRIEFTCRGCGAESELFGDDASRRRLETSAGAFYSSTVSFQPRFLQALPPSGDECICPINPEETGPPTRDEFVTAYRRSLEILAAQGNVTFIGGVDEVVEVDAISCTGNDSIQTANVAVNVTGDPDGIPWDDRIALEAGFARAYNDLAENSCDSLFRTVVNATLAVVLPTGVDNSTESSLRRRRLMRPRLNYTSPFTLFYKVTFKCKGCAGGGKSKLFGNDGGRRLGVSPPPEVSILPEANIANIDSTVVSSRGGRSSHRFLQADESCFCDIRSVKKDAPSVAEFAVSFEEVVVVELNVPSIVSVVGASPVPTIPGVWQQRGFDINGAATGDDFGHAISLSSDGTVLAVGGPLHDNRGLVDAGMVRVYEWISNQWVQRGSDFLGADGDFQTDNFGVSVSLSSDGNTLAIGAPNEGRSLLSDQGAVRVFDWSTNQWIQRGSTIIGKAVVLSRDGSSIVVGGAQKNYGYFLVLDWSSDSGEWVQRGDRVSHAHIFSDFGEALSISTDSNTVAVGVTGDTSAKIGAATVFRWSSNGWIRVPDRVGADGNIATGMEDLEYFGTSIAMSGDASIVAIGAPSYSDRAGVTGVRPGGRAVVYQLVSDKWVQRGPDILGQARRDGFGRSVSLSSDGSVLAVGADGHDGENGVDSGQVSVYEWSDNEWVQRATDIEGEAPGDLSGSSVSLSSDGNTLAIGAVKATGAQQNTGHVRVYTFSGSDD